MGLHKVIASILWKMSSFRSIHRISFKAYTSETNFQKKNFEALNLDRDNAKQRLNIVLNEIHGENYSESSGMWSEHLILLAALQNANCRIDRILEIGTFDGKTTKILSKLFPESLIVTIDLPSSQIFSKKIYVNDNKNNQLAERRISNLSGLANIEFREMNSLTLTFEESKFDLIWVDGAHGYPTVAIDIVNALRLINEGGYVLCDDVYTTTISNDPEYTSIGAYETLKELKEAGLIELNLILKRLGWIYNYSKNSRKYIGVFQKI